MILKEFEGKKLLTAVGLNIPRSVLISKGNINDINKAHSLKFPIFVKAQVLHGNRELESLIKKVENKENLKNEVECILNKKDRYGQEISHVIVEEMVEFTQAIYINISYSTKTRTPVIQYSEQGGTGMDDRGDGVSEFSISIIEGVKEFPIKPELLSVLQKLFTVFERKRMR